MDQDLDLKLFFAKVRTAYYEVLAHRYERRRRLLELELRLLRGQIK